MTNFWASCQGTTIPAAKSRYWLDGIYQFLTSGHRHQDGLQNGRQTTGSHPGLDICELPSSRLHDLVQPIQDHAHRVAPRLLRDGDELQAVGRKLRAEALVCSAQNVAELLAHSRGELYRAGVVRGGHLLECVPQRLAESLDQAEDGCLGVRIAAGRTCRNLALVKVANLE